MPKQYAKMNGKTCQNRMQRGPEEEVDEVRGQAPGTVKKKKKYKSKNRRK